MGGSYHDLLVQGALACGVSLGLFFGAFAWIGSRGAANGSVLATRLRERLPSTVGLLASTSLWYLCAEAIEPRHDDVAPVVLLLALALVSWLTHRLACAAVGAVARAVIAIRRHAFSARTPEWTRRAQTRPVARRIAWARRRFARPPPIAICRA